MELWRAILSARSLASGLPSTQTEKRGPTRGRAQISHRLQGSGPSVHWAARGLSDRRLGESSALDRGDEVGGSVPGRVGPNSFTRGVSLDACKRTMYSRDGTLSFESTRVRERDLATVRAPFLLPRSRECPLPPRPCPGEASRRRLVSLPW